MRESLSLLQPSRSPVSGAFDSISRDSQRRTATVVGEFHLIELGKFCYTSICVAASISGANFEGKTSPRENVRVFEDNKPTDCFRCGARNNFCGRRWCGILCVGFTPSDLYGRFP